MMNEMFKSHEYGKEMLHKMEGGELASEKATRGILQPFWWGGLKGAFKKHFQGDSGNVQVWMC